MKIRSQKGIAHVAALLVILVIAAVAGGGYYVYHKHHKKAATVSSTTTTQAPSFTDLKGSVLRVKEHYGLKTSDGNLVEFRISDPDRAKCNATVLLSIRPFGIGDELTIRAEKVGANLYEVCAKGTYAHLDQAFMTISQWGVKVPVDSSMKRLSYTITAGIAYVRSAALNAVSDKGCTTNSVALARGTANEQVPSEGASPSPSDPNYSQSLFKNSKLKIGNYYYVQPAGLGAGCTSDIAKQAKETAAEAAIKKALDKLVAE